MKFIFLNYLDRSGSTLLMEYLSTFRSWATLPEGERLINELLIEQNKHNAHSLQQLFSLDHKLKHWSPAEGFFKSLNYNQSPPDLFLEILQSYAQTILPECQGVVFKAYEWVNVSLDMIKTITEKGSAEMLFLVRDPRAIFYSQINTVYRGQRLGNNTLIFSQKWNLLVGKIKSLEKVFPEIKVVRYEDLIMKPAETLNRILPDRIDLKLAKDIGSYLSQLGPEEKKLHTPMSLYPDETKIDRWRKNLEPCRQVIIEYMCRKGMKVLEYLPDYTRFALWYRLPACIIKVLLKEYRNRQNQFY